MDAPTLTKLVGQISKATASKDANDTRSDEDYKKENTEVSDCQKSMTLNSVFREEEEDVDGRSSLKR